MDISYYKKYEPIFGSWKIVREIGEGSFGKVFEIEREDFGRTYKAALKAITIPQNQSEVKSISDGMDEESVTEYFQGIVEEMVDEFALMSQLKGNSNIVSYEDHVVIKHSDSIGWDILIRMELLTPLFDYTHGRTVSRDEVIRLGIDICKALEACKMCRVIHRDIKPENIFISKLGDFGIAKTVEKTTGGLSTKGTYTYMAPEVYKGEAYGSSVDIYSLGLMLYRYMNNGREPFLPPYPARIKYVDKEAAMARRIKGEEIPAPANADEALANIILKACAYNPKDRYANPTEMRKALESLGPESAALASVVKDEITNIAEAETVRDNEVEADRTISVFGAVEKKEIIETTLEAKTVSDVEEGIDKTVSAFVTAEAKNVAETEKEDISKKESVKTEIKEEKTAENANKPKKKRTTIIGIITAVLAVFAIIFFGQKGPTDLAAISAGRNHTVCLKQNGTVAAVGLNESGQCDVSNWTDIAAISAGCYHTVGLKSDGTVVAIGDNTDRQCDVSNWTDIAAVSAGLCHTVGLKTDGTVVAVGFNGNGQCNVDDWTDIIAISAGSNHTVGLKSDGTVVVTGDNNWNQCDVSDWTEIKAISAGGSFTVGLKTDGTVIAVGFKGNGKCSVDDWTDIVAISAGVNHTVGLKSDGTVIAVGSISNGQCNVTDWTDIVAISAGTNHTVGLKSDGTVVAVGSNKYGQCDIKKLK